jgi:valyl-tRNA synthetase
MYTGEALQRLLMSLAPHLERDDLCVRLTWPDSTSQLLHSSISPTDLAARAGTAEVEVLLCWRDAQAESDLGPALTALGLEQDPDVLDTWFSSGLWPMSTLGWPDPATAVVDPGQAALGSQDGQADCLAYYYPGSCLVTGRDIITLWVARMMLMGLYNMGDVPFTDVFIHANILDGKGERMSKSRGNGVDPVDIIERYGTDAMRYVLCDMQTGMQDIRLPVQAISPYTGELVDLATARHGRSIFTYLCPATGQEFDVLGTMPEVPAAKLVSDRFEVGRNFCNKLLNAVRFALLNLQDATFTPRQYQDLADEDRWMLSRLSATIAEVQRQLTNYNPSAALSSARDFFWSELCDWYLECIKPRLRHTAQAPLARQVLASAIDQILRLLHPFVPYITEALWEPLCAQAPVRGLEDPLPASELLIGAAWPASNPAWRDVALEARMTFVQEVIRGIRDLRSKYTISPHVKVPVRIRATDEAAVTLGAATDLIVTMAGLESIAIAPDLQRSPDAATVVVGPVEVSIPGVVDVDKEKARLTKQREQLLGRLEGSRRKLANADFLRKASAEVVQKERDRLAESEAQIEHVEATLAALG